MKSWLAQGSLGRRVTLLPGTTFLHINGALISRGSFSFGIAFGCIIIADLISGEQTELNVGKTVFHFVSRGSSCLGSVFG